MSIDKMKVSQLNIDKINVIQMNIYQIKVIQMDGGHRCAPIISRFEVTFEFEYTHSFWKLFWEEALRSGGEDVIKPFYVVDFMQS